MKNVLMFFHCFILSSLVFAGTKNVSVDFELSETAINRAIVSQFNDPNFAFQHFTGTFEIDGLVNVPYSVELSRPTVVIENNSVGLCMSFSFEASLGGNQYNYDFEITPSLTVNETSILASNVVAFLENFEDEINSHTGIEWEIRALIIGLYNAYEPQVYAAELFNETLEEINSDEFFQQRAFSITDFGISMGFNVDKLVIKAIIEVTYEDTKFVTKITNTNPDKLLFSCNIKCRVKSVIILNVNTGVYSNDNLDLELTKNPSTGMFIGEINLGDVLATNEYTWKVRFETDATFYYNLYKGFPVGSSWSLPEKRLNH